MNHLMFLRLKKDLSQKALAELLKINPVTMCRIERGWYAKPPVELEHRLQIIFGKEWTFERLMEPVPDITANDSDAA
jgi:DNA-binding XRE family transcriptional regulator